MYNSWGRDHVRFVANHLSHAEKSSESRHEISQSRLPAYHFIARKRMAFCRCSPCTNADGLKGPKAALSELPNPNRADHQVFFRLPIKPPSHHADTDSMIPYGVFYRKLASSQRFFSAEKYRDTECVPNGIFQFVVISRICVLYMRVLIRCPFTRRQQASCVACPGGCPFCISASGRWEMRHGPDYLELLLKQ